MQKLPRLGRPTRGVAKTHFGSYGEPDGQAQGTILRCERCDGLRAKRKLALSKTLGGRDVDGREARVVDLSGDGRKSGNL